MASTEEPKTTTTTVTELIPSNFASYKPSNIIENGDLVVLYLNRETMSVIRMDAKASYNCKFGTYLHSDIIGQEYGTKMASNTGRGFIYVLYPTPELWTQVLPHRTQILYIADISFVMSFLNLRPGMSMIESGTGSGSFSHSIARTLAPNGHLYSFEYHEERAKIATKEFSDHGISDLVTLECRDVCKDGFGLENKVDAVFLDLPAPWDAVESAKKAFKQDRIGKICTFSPCIEQIARTVTALNDHGFVDIQMYECLIRYNETRMIPLWTIDQAMERQQHTNLKRKRFLAEKRIETKKARAEKEKKKVAVALAKEGEDVDMSSGNSTAASTPGGGEPSATSSTTGTPSGSSTAVFTAGEEDLGIEDDEAFLAQKVEDYVHPDPKNVLITRLPNEQRGHTSYLMFATFRPAESQAKSLTELAAEKKAAALSTA